MNQKPLAGKTVLITRARDQSAEFAGLLRDVGAEVIEFPTIEIVPPASWEGLDRAFDQMDSYDWIIFTSANGVEFFWKRLNEKGKDQGLLSALKVCAIGPGTARQLRENGIAVDYTPKEFIAEAILKGFEEMAVKGRRILLVRAKVARDVLPEGLRKMGAEVDVVDIYQTVKPKNGSKRLRQLLTDRRIDVVTFTSSSTVNHFFDLLEEEHQKELPKNIAIACIGPITAETAKGRGTEVHIQPEQYTIPGLTRAIVEYFTAK